jgi:putative ATPase
MKQADTQAEQLATQTPLPPIPLQIRNAPTTLVRKLGYGKEYAYNPAYAHPVHNVGLLRFSPPLHQFPIR